TVMKDRFLSRLILSVGLGALVASFAQAQQVVGDSFPSKDSPAKRCIVVYGAVKSPARFELQRRVRLAEAIAAAGGLSDRAGKNRSTNSLRFGLEMRPADGYE